MLKYSFKYIDERNISILWNPDFDKESDPLNRFTCPALEIYFQEEDSVQKFKDYISTLNIPKHIRALPLNRIVSYIISDWSYHCTSWIRLYGHEIRAQMLFNEGDGQYLDGKLLTYRGSKIFKKLKPIIVKVLNDRGIKYA